MKRKGFTLIELLAVIIILAVIALIATPMIMDVIEKAKKQAFLDSAYGIIEAGEYFYSENIFENSSNSKERYDFKVKNKEFVYVDDETKKLSYKGQVPKTGMLQIKSNGESAIAICNDTYCACKSISELKVTIKESNCNINSETGEIDDDIVKDRTPAGSVISYMAGSSAPDGYLACDGAIYNIGDYQNLADAIKEGFGTYNYYGGDGTSTFAVPDLRGEFLRGSGSNGHTNQGNGSSVGVHQDATLSPYVFSDSANVTITGGVANPDWLGVYKAGDVYKYVGANSANYTRNRYSSRPTNTSVLYCIKY